VNYLAYLRQVLTVLYSFLLAFFIWLRSAFSEEGQGSWSRLGSGIIIATWAYIAVKHLAIPERTPELIGVLAALYGANQLREAVAAFKRQPDQPQS
jgi:uncharacterized membrane protein YGL010W